MKKPNILSVSFSVVFALVLVSMLALSASAEEKYMKRRGPCRVCDDIEKIVGKVDGANEGTIQSKATLELGKYIKAMKLKGPVEAQRRDIYYAIRASVDHLAEDFDGETGLGLLDLREQNRKEFDYVFQRFPLEKQQALLKRFSALFERNLRKKRPLPEAKEA